jgi:hypothetical protein
LFGFFAVKTFLVYLVISDNSILSVSHLQAPLEHLLFLILLRDEHIRGHLLVVDGQGQVLVVSCLAYPQFTNCLLSLSLANLGLMFDDSSPLVKLAVLVNRVIPHLLSG